MIVGKVELVARKHKREIRGGEGARIVEKGLKVVEGRMRGDVVDKDCARCAAIIGS